MFDLAFITVLLYKLNKQATALLQQTAGGAVPFEGHNAGQLGPSSVAKQMFGWPSSWGELPGGATEPRARLIPSTEVSVQLFLTVRADLLPVQLRALPQPSHQTARALLFQPSPAWGHPLPALPGVSSESPGQAGWWVTLFAPVAQPRPHLPVGSSGGPSWKDQFSAIPAPTRRVGVWVRVHDMSGTPSEKVRRGFQALRSLKAQDVLSPPPQDC